MSVAKFTQSTLRPLLAGALWSSALLTACIADQPGLSGGSAGDVGKGNAPGAAGEPSEVGSTTGGSVSQGGSAGTTSAGTGTVEVAGSSTQGGGENAAAGADNAAGGDMPAGAAGSPEVPVAMSCLFHTEAPPSSGGGGGSGTGGSGGTAGSGGSAGGPTGNVVVQLSPFVGSYLTDSSGRTLYTYGGDLPGDCKVAPVSKCETDCAVSWPPFDAGPRALGAGLDDAAFGTIQRGDGSSQTTYYGWPLYYYKADLSLGQLTGQGKGKTWQTAQVRPPSIVIMKTGTAKYLADAAGHTLYVSSADQVGSSDADPVSNCDKGCLDSFAPFDVKALSMVGSLDPADFSVFVRHGKGGLQIAYKGAPLYRASTDLASGDMHGTATAGFTAAVP